MKFPWKKDGQDISFRNRNKHNGSGRNRKEIYGSLLSRFQKKEPRPDKDIRSNFGQTQDVRQIWDLSEKDAYVRQHGKRKIPRFVLPVMIFVFFGILLFWLLPGVVSRYFGTAQDTPQEVTVPIKMYSESTRVVDVYVANLFSQPDIKSDRITQVLYNEPVTLIDTAGTAEFIHIKTKDGIEGYIKSSDVTADTDSVEPNMHKYKLLVSDVSKNIMSHSNNGTLLIQVMMNTVLYADGKSEGVYQVVLPTGEKGWISSSGVIELGVMDPAEKVSVRYFVSSVLSFVNVTQLDHGITMRGLSVEGLAYVSAEVNGVDIPRTMSEQVAAGARVDLTYDKVTGLLDVSSISPGDLVFFRDPDDATSAAPYEMGICTDTGSIIMSSSSRTTLRLVTLADSQELEGRIIAVRRIFS